VNFDGTESRWARWPAGISLHQFFFSSEIFVHARMSRFAAGEFVKKNGPFLQVQ
jgi:hypothetical protein